MAFRSGPITPEQCFSGCDPLSREPFEAVRSAVERVDAEMRGWLREAWEPAAWAGRG
ncbi:hypothetical protein GCM10023081_34670 [Arthrobacter ginkgonis]|uniref:Uncharacterized protein n=1 Tax=Arthrobacter ginkgonis TaxID=1630594 RepID=A0ABP7CTH8_9MICC